MLHAAYFIAPLFFNVAEREGRTGENNSYVTFVLKMKPGVYLCPVSKLRIYHLWSDVLRGGKLVAVTILLLTLLTGSWPG